jgi:hypothetical protein
MLFLANRANFPVCHTVAPRFLFIHGVVAVSATTHPETLSNVAAGGHKLCDITILAIN